MSTQFSSPLELSTALTVPGWDGTPATKFRAPRQRRDLVVRSALIQRGMEMVQDHPVTLVCAPAGFGKSTFLLQLAQAMEKQAKVVWLALDADDNDLNRFFVTLVASLRELPLQWDVLPRLLASQVQGNGQQTRAAVAAVANALDTFTGERLLLILDDFHCVTDPAALQMLADLIERLPVSVSLILGSRTEPLLPIARWRMRGALGELRQQDLQFDSADTRALALLRQAGGPAELFTPEFIEKAFHRTQGWAAGLALVFGVTSGPLVEHLQAAADKSACRHLFDFFAREVLAELPADLAEFILNCSVLPELTPALCQAVTGREDAQQVLEELYRRNLFLTALDETALVMRFHDLFADFLQSQLRRLHPEREATLHELAAQAEQVPLRAVNHWLKAQRWEQAVAAIDACLDPLLAEGGLALVERWLVQLPEAERARPEVWRLQALCAWAGWDFERAFACLEKACAGYLAAGNNREYLRHFALLPRAYNSVGRFAESEKALTQAATLPLDEPERVNCLAARAWQEMAQGRPANVAASVQAIVDAAEQNTALLVPAIDDMFNSFMFGMEGALHPLLRLRALCRAQLNQPNVSWQLEAFAHTTWPEFWLGDRSLLRDAIARQSAVQARLSIIPALRLNSRQAEAWEAAAEGNYEQAIATQKSTLAAMEELAVPGLTNTWHRATTLNLAHFLWMARDEQGLKALWPYLSTPPSTVEWPAIRTGQAHLRGQLALLAGDYAEAETALQEAVKLQTQWPLPTFFGDVRVTLALLRWQQGEHGNAWELFQPLLERSLAEETVGLLLTAPRFALDPLLALIPVELMPRYRLLLDRLASWQVVLPTASVTAPSLPPVLQELSQREREVLAHIAAGDSNKIIARALDLSPHTVKRHVANILGKLDCATRGQAAALWRSYSKTS